MIKTKHRIISLLLILCFLLSSLLVLSSCSSEDGGAEDDGGDGATDGSDTGGDGTEDDSDGKSSYLDKVIKPQIKEYDRSTIKFSEIKYTRPDYATIIALADEVIALVKSDSASFEAMLDKIDGLDEACCTVLTMNSFAKIYNSKDASIEFWQDEYLYISQNYSTLAKKVEELYVACANSPHAERFEAEYFGDQLIEEYKDGGKLSANAVELLAKEAVLVSNYAGISTATIDATYGGVTDSIDNILNFYAEKYGKSSTQYLAAQYYCLTVFQEKSAEIATDIFIELVRVRALLATERGYSSYLEYAYSEGGFDYSAEDTANMLESISAHVVPIYKNLSLTTFDYYFSENQSSDVTPDKLLNNGYHIFNGMDASLFDVYCYMLQFGLFDIEKSATADNRADGAFTTYLYDYEAPFTFISSSGKTADYGTLFHEFGHFAEFFYNGNPSNSIDFNEVMSQSLEFLALQYSSSYISSSDKQYLFYLSMKNALETLMYQGFYARFEEAVYKLSHSQITEQKLDEIVTETATEFGFNTEYVNSVSIILTPHFFHSPLYVQSYCTSVIPSLEILFRELDKRGAGLALYLKLLDRENAEVEFLDALQEAGLTSPFRDGQVKKMAAEIYYRITGCRYDKSSDGNSTVSTDKI